MRIRRREFLKIGAAAASAAAVGSPVLNAFAEPLRLPLDHGRRGDVGQWKPSTCQGCTTWCPAEVLVQGGRAVKVAGNRNSLQNDGTLCPKGHLSIQELYDPDRVKVPMKRTNPKKGRGVDPGFVPISWDEALDMIADKMMELRDAGVPEKFLLMRGRYTYMRDTIYGALPKVFGSPNGISHSAICAEAEKFGSYYTAGNWSYRDYDISNTKYLLIWGADPLSSNRMIPATIRRFGDVLDNATVAVIDPRLNSSAAKAHEWLPIKPGTDGALASAIAHQILVDGKWNREFVGDFADGTNRFKAGATVAAKTFTQVYTHGLVNWWNLELKDKSPAWAAAETSVPAEQIVRVARGMAAAAPKVCVWLGPGAAMHVRGAYSAMGVHALNGLLGGIDNVGGALASASIPVKSIPDFGPYQDELAKKHSKMEKIDQRGRLEFPVVSKGKSGGGVVTNNAANGILADDPNDIQVAIGYMNNFAFSCTGTERWERALAKIPFFAHITTNASETTMFADVVLPAAITQFEKLGYVKTKANRYATCTLVQPVIEPLWEARVDETEVVWDLAVKLQERGFSNLIDYFRTEYKDPETGAEPTNGLEFTEYGLKIQTAPLWDGKEDVGGDRINGWQAFLKRGMWNSSPYPYKKRWGKFKTKTHQFEFYSETLKEALTKHAEKHGTTIDGVLEACNYEARGELAFVPHYETPYRYGDRSEYPFDFVDYKSRLNREGRSQNTPWYYEFKHVDVGDVGGEDVIKINPADAARIGVGDGDVVKVSSTVGSFVVKAKLFEGITPGTAAKCYGQGHWAYGRVAAKDFGRGVARGGNNNSLMPDDYERLSGSTVRNGGFTGVKIEKA